jgi:hypothetical protein
MGASLSSKQRFFVKKRAKTSFVWRVPPGKPDSREQKAFLLPFVHKKKTFLAKPQHAGE